MTILSGSPNVCGSIATTVIWPENILLARVTACILITFIGKVPNISSQFDKYGAIFQSSIKNAFSVGVQPLICTIDAGSTAYMNYLFAMRRYLTNELRGGEK